MDLRFVPLELARIDELRYEALALPFFEDERPLQGAAGLCDWRLCGRLSSLLARGRIGGARGEATLMPAARRLPFDKLVLLGLGARGDFGREGFEDASRHVLSAMRGLQLRSFVLALPGRGTQSVSPADAAKWFLPLADAEGLDEVVLLDVPEAHRAMQPIIEAERARLRRARDLG